MTPELKLMTEWEEAREAYVKAKQHRAKDPKAYEAAKKKMSDMRTYWRQVGEAAGTRTPVAPLPTKAG